MNVQRQSVWGPNALTGNYAIEWIRLNWLRKKLNFLGWDEGGGCSGETTGMLQTSAYGYKVWLVPRECNYLPWRSNVLDRYEITGCQIRGTSLSVLTCTTSTGPFSFSLILKVFDFDQTGWKRIFLMLASVMRSYQFYFIYLGKLKNKKCFTITVLSILIHIYIFELLYHWQFLNVTIGLWHRPQHWS